MSLPGIVARLRTGALTILLDYDGTLVPIKRTPALAMPDKRLLPLLASLAERPWTALHLVSGRPRDTIDEWFAHLPATLWAEHGFWSRRAPHGPWEQAGPVPTEALRRVYPILEEITRATPGSLIEQKNASLAWHYRRAAPELGERQADALRVRLAAALIDEPLEILEGKKVIEVRPRGVSKALASQSVLASHDPDAAILAIGDDVTDEDLFGALPDASVTIAVGTGHTRARYFVDDHRAVRALLSMLL